MCIFLSKSKSRVNLLLINLLLECYEKINQIQNFIWFSFILSAISQTEWNRIFNNSSIEAKCGQNQFAQRKNQSVIVERQI